MRLTVEFRNADSPTVRDDGSIVFVKPYEEDMLLLDFLDYVVRQETDPESLAPDSEVRYAQTRKPSQNHHVI
jgi:jumonji domain-containing protein 7